MPLGNPFGGYLALRTNDVVYAVRSLWITAAMPGVIQLETITDGSPVYEVPIDDVVDIKVIKQTKKE